MNREIKFRIWFANRFTYLGDINSPNTFSLHCPSGGAVFQQFTGLRDKNDKEIYEGDIVKVKVLNNVKVGDCYESQESDAFCSIFWDNNGSRFGADESCRPRQNGFGYWDFHSGFATRIEVVGNIYENPELLN